MTFALWAATAICGVVIVLHLASIAIAIARCRPQARIAVPLLAPPITIIRPACGLDNFDDLTLRSTFELDYPRYEILFCIASAKDPVAGLLSSLLAQHPHVPARILIGDERISDNPKLNNVLKGWRAATSDLVVMSDSNLLLPPDYVQRVLASMRPDTGLVSAPPIGSHPQSFGAQLECAFLNAYQARWQYAADTLGFGFAQGKTLFCRRSDIEPVGGLRALASEAAEDAACTKLVRASGRRVRLADAPFEQPLGARDWSDVWSRQVRWARLRRDSFPAFYRLEILAGVGWPLVAAGFVAYATGYSVVVAGAILLALWYGAEMMLAAIAGWHLPLLYPVHAMLRDALLPVLWFEGWRGNGFVWRGHTMSIDESSVTPPA